MICMVVRNLPQHSFANALSALTTFFLLALLTSPAQADNVHIIGIPGVTDGDTVPRMAYLTLWAG
jgi:hypothetical protein